jgi:hypothetical protein
VDFGVEESRETVKPDLQRLQSANIGKMWKLERSFDGSLDQLSLFISLFYLRKVVVPPPFVVAISLLRLVDK